MIDIPDVNMREFQVIVSGMTWCIRRRSRQRAERFGSYLDLVLFFLRYHMEGRREIVWDFQTPSASINELIASPVHFQHTTESGLPCGTAFE